MQVHYLLAGIVLLLFESQVAPQKITVDGLTKVGDELRYSNGSDDIKLVEQKYNSAEKTMALGFKTYRADVESPSVIPSKDLKFSLVIVNPEKSKIKIIPTTNNRIAVLNEEITKKKLIKKHKKNIDNDISIIESDKNNIESQEKENQYNIKSDQKRRRKLFNL